MSRDSQVSVIVNTKNSERTIVKHLSSIKKQTYKNIEIIVVDNNSKDKTCEIARRFTKKIYIAGPERSAQRNFGVKHSNGTYVLIPDSDMILSERVIEACVELIKKKRTVRAIIIPEQSIGKGFWAQCKILERSYYPGVDWIEAARFFDKETFLSMGGYDERNTGTEDYDLPQRIKKKYGTLSTGRISEYMYHDEGNLSLLYVLKKKFYYAKSLRVYKKNNTDEYSKQKNIIKRFSLFFSDPQKLFRDPAIGVGMLFMKSCEFTAGGIGYIASITG